MAKAAFWTITDAEARKRGEQTGLDTLVVHAVKMCIRDSSMLCVSPPKRKKRREISNAYKYSFHLSGQIGRASCRERV